MAAEAGILDEVRRRLSHLEARHEADGRGAAEAFWKSLTAELGREPSVGSGTAGAQATAATVPRRRCDRGPRQRSMRLPRRGVWRHVEPASSVEQHPSEVGWSDWDALDVDGADAEWLAAAAVRALAPERSEPVAVKIDAMTGMALARHGDAEVTAAIEDLAGLRAQHDVMLVNVLAEVESRGLDLPDGLSRTDWLRSLDPGLTAGQAKDFVTVARAVALPRWRELGARVTMQHVTVAKAARIIEFHDRLARVADADELEGAVSDLVAQAPQLGPEDFGRLVRHHTEQVRPPREEDGEARDEGRRASRGLWFSEPTATGMVTFRGMLDPEAAAVMKSAIDPLSMPCPTRDRHGHMVQADPRSPARRRADALVEVVERGVAAADRVPRTDKAKVVVTVDLGTLLGTLRGAGHTMSGDVLSPASVRRMACDAEIIPMVLGTQGEPLDVGRRRRLVTPGLRAALWRRDSGCSFPACSKPAQWTDAHHVLPWWLGGRTSLLNTALLCRRHHTHVHRHGLTATVTATGVTWHV